MEYCAGGEFFRTLQKQPGKHLSGLLLLLFVSQEDSIVVAGSKSHEKKKKNCIMQSISLMSP
jgi:hypothetical protein